MASLPGLAIAFASTKTSVAGLPALPDDTAYPTLYERIGGHDGLALLLRRFYADVRQHSEIGPIFSEHIEDWPAHLEKIAGFWSGLTGSPALYGGGMAARHIPLRLEEKHFQAWLGLCTATAPRTCPQPRRAS